MSIVMDGCMLMNKCPTGEGEKKHNSTNLHVKPNSVLCSCFQNNLVKLSDAIYWLCARRLGTDS